MRFRCTLSFVDVQVRIHQWSILIDVAVVMQLLLITKQTLPAIMDKQVSAVMEIRKLRTSSATWMSSIATG